MADRPARTLHLTLTRRWFDMIASGEKREEYREIKPYWTRRLADLGTDFDRVQFRNGYRADSPKLTAQIEGIFVGYGRPEWGAPAERVYIIRLGSLLELANGPEPAR